MNVGVGVLFAILMIEQCDAKGGRGGGRGRSRGRSRGSSSSLSYYGRWTSVRRPSRPDATRARLTANSFPDSPSYSGFRNSLSQSKSVRYLPNAGSMVLLLHPSVAFYYGGREYYWSRYFYENRANRKDDVTFCERSINQTSYLSYIFLDDNNTQAEALIWECDLTEYCCDAECCQKPKYVWIWIIALICACIAVVVLWERRKRTLHQRFVKAENEYRNSELYLIRRMSSTKSSNMIGDPPIYEKVMNIPETIRQENKPDSWRLPSANDAAKKSLCSRGKHLYHL
ncbi:hypothetical protein Tcan_12187 [Toxocara canis]|uniref:CX domain-containing protein n=1 Tax=Toxocara canis TaxID=6265 RepID=A0A0B2UMQ7_TOXCA|nr:hypothetical protein Tcan_12187 [Toxocara canis]